MGRCGLAETPHAGGNEIKVLKAVLGACGTFAALAAAIYVFGGIVLLLRLETKGLRGEVVVASLPREFLVSVGLAVLLQLLFLVLILLGAFIQQAGGVTALGRPGADARLARGIRLLLVGSATAVLALPLARWMDSMTCRGGG